MISIEIFCYYLMQSLFWNMQVITYHAILRSKQNIFYRSLLNLMATNIKILKYQINLQDSAVTASTNSIFDIFQFASSKIPGSQMSFRHSIVHVSPSGDDIEIHFVISNLFLRRLIAGSSYRNSTSYDTFPSCMVIVMRGSWPSRAILTICWGRTYEWNNN